MVFMDAEADQYAPELVRDNSIIDIQASFADGYQPAADLIDQSIRFSAGHVIGRLVHDMNIGGEHIVFISNRIVTV